MHSLDHPWFERNPWHWYTKTSLSEGASGKRYSYTFMVVLFLYSLMLLFLSWWFVFLCFPQLYIANKNFNQYRSYIWRLLAIHYFGKCLKTESSRQLTCNKSNLWQNKNRVFFLNQLHNWWAVTCNCKERISHFVIYLEW